MIAGRVESIWRYPVKSMRGEKLEQAFAGFAGVYGDRVYAVRSSRAPKGFPYLTGREQQQMLLYRPFYRHRGPMMEPPNFHDAEALAPGLTTVYADAAGQILDVETPSGEVLPIDDPRLLEMLQSDMHREQELTLLRSDRSMTDCRPISIFSIQTAGQLAKETGRDIDKRRFRANIYVDLSSEKGFAEDEFVGRTLRIGEKVTIAILQRDSRCKMITLDPDTGEADPEIMRCLAKSHESKAGVYGAVLIEGIIRPGDPVEQL
jgi:hypothetical protein